MRSDAELLRGSAGDSDAFAELYRRHRGSVARADDLQAHSDVDGSLAWHEPRPRRPGRRDDRHDPGPGVGASGLRLILNGGLNVFENRPKGTSHGIILIPDRVAKITFLDIRLLPDASPPGIITETRKVLAGVHIARAGPQQHRGLLGYRTHCDDSSSHPGKEASVRYC